MDTTETLIEGLQLVSENVLAEAARLPLDFISAARYRVTKMRLRNQASIELDTARAKMALQIRAEKDEEGKKVTEGNLNQQIEASDEIVALRAAFETAVQREELAKLILEAYRLKRDAIRVIAEAQTFEGHEYGEEANKILRQKLSKKARQIAQQKKEQSLEEE